MHEGALINTVTCLFIFSTFMSIFFFLFFFPFERISELGNFPLLVTWTITSIIYC